MCQANHGKFGSSMTPHTWAAQWLHVVLHVVASSSFDEPFSGALFPDSHVHLEELVVDLPSCSAVAEGDHSVHFGLYQMKSGHTRS